MVPPDKINLYCRILNAFENDSGSPETDYKSIYIYRDGKNKRRQVTLGRGFTDDGGSLRLVVERYIAKQGQLSAEFNARLDKFGKGVLADDKNFIRALTVAASEPAMHDAQDEIFHEVYLQPALDWAQQSGFMLPLSVGVIVDSFLQSGKILPWLVAKFTEKKPVAGGDEKLWIGSYLKERLAWFERMGAPLHNTRYRPLFFQGEISKNNWSFNCPLVANGSQIC